MSALRRFFAFWSDFLVGDRPELFFGPVLGLVAVWGLIGAGLSPAAGGVLLFALVAGVGAFSLWRTLPR